MPTWLQTQLASGFAAFSGSTISATVPIKQELINELLAEYLAEEATTAPADPRWAEVPFAQLKTLVRRAAVRAEAGVVTLDLEIRV
ncbi:MAG: hypothetical protein ABR606_18930 [Vicinamibacterales bacterium]